MGKNGKLYYTVAWIPIGVIWLVKGGKRVFPWETIYYIVIFHTGKLLYNHFYGDKTRGKDTIKHRNELIKAKACAFVGYIQNMKSISAHYLLEAVLRGIVRYKKC